MSHGNTEKCEPNFTPLLDLVLQLVMFFMISANFVMDQTNIEIKLPEAISAKALGPDVRQTIFLNVNAQGQVVLPPVDRDDENATLDNAIQVEGYLKRRAKIEQVANNRQKPEATLILRVDSQTPFEKSYPIMKACRNAGYTNVMLRAIRFGGQEG